MLQRIQSVFLLIIAVLSALTIVLPLATITDGQQVYLFRYCAVWVNFPEKIFSSTFILPAVSFLITILSVITLFLYKKRRLQIRLTWGNVVLMLAYYVVYGVYFNYISQMLGSGAIWSWGIANTFQAINLVLALLSINYINKDEKLVKSLDRLR